MEAAKVHSPQATCRAQLKETTMTDLASMKNEALTSEELAGVSGGIIIVSGLQQRFTSALERVALNPQPLPPRLFSLTHR